MRRLLGEPRRGEFGWTVRRPDGGRWDVRGDWLRDDPVIPGVQVRTRCPLCAALDEGDEAAARHAMFHHVGLHRACDKSTSPTERLVTGGHADLIREWLASGVSSAALGRWGMPAQHIAARHNRLDVIKVLAEAGVKLVGHRGDDGSLLHAALKARGHDVARWLVARGADIEVPGSRGRRPLHVAAERGSVDLVRDLIAAGADVHARDDAGRTPLLALGERNAAEVARLLIDAGARVDVVDASGYSPLRRAAAEREPEALLQVLLAAGAEVDAAGDDGGTALYAAVGSRRLAAVRILIAAGARPDGVRGGGFTPLQHAVMNKFDYGRSEVALALIAAGADVHARDAEGNTVLHWAAAHGRTAVVLALLDAGAACDEPDSRGVRPIERAVRGGKPAMIDALRRAGADMRGCREQALTQALRKPSRRTLGGLRAVLGAEDRLGPAERLALRRRLGPRSPESACAGDAELAAWLRAALGWSKAVGREDG